jgi:calcium/calmodulin-dependent 3',5'-cyclic nucleotide phosphodiesterase
MDLPEKRLSFDTTSRSSTSSSDSCSSPSPIGAGKLPNGYHSRIRSSLTSQESTNVVKGVARTRDLLNQLERGDYPDHDELVDTLKFVGNILSVVAEKNSPINELNEALPHVLSDEVRAWLTSTFTENRAPSLSRSDRRPPSFKAVVGTIMVGQYIGKMIESQAKSYPAGVTEFFEVILTVFNVICFFCI